MNKKMIIAAVAGLSAVVLLAGFGPGRFGHPRSFDPQKAYRFLTFKVDSKLDELNATEAQRAQVGLLKEELWAEGLKLHEGQQAARKALLGEWEAARVDSSRVHAVVDERFDAYRAFAHRLADAAIKLHGLLTPEQRAQVRATVPPQGGER